MSISITAIVTAYDAVGTAASTTATAKAAIVSLGNRPTYPVDCDTDASYNNVTTSIATFDASLITLQATYNTAVTAQRALEATCIAAMAPNQWFKLTGLANWGAAATQYIGVANNGQTNATGLDTANSCKLFTIFTYGTLPTRVFPAV